MNQEVVVNGDPKTAKLIYILNFVSLVFGITSLVAVIMAYINKDGAEPWLSEHYRYQIRTFWIGMLYGVISLILCVILIGFVLAFALLVWFIIRNVKGFQALEQGQAPTNVDSWLF
ncbi:hypothetical protein VST7929_00261 [Vibrio stylophorae]|uniref:DUF4870 domain-containing protein n=1 Tax=Vibrio stylophorae TaxID=659351 RepID=A0ABM8ZQ59_9VIBR|nr:DUF4870 domain-containing protein [Vibrio stylophorae]CAH0532432.1 hypothetical protein VST7929_00261 [Vibrio stylophorae]